METYWIYSGQPKLTYQIHNLNHETMMYNLKKSKLKQILKPSSQST